MARRGRSGHGRGPLSRELRHRIISSKNDGIPDEELVDCLRKSFPEYYHQKLQPFTSQVQNILQFLNPNSKPTEEEETAPRKKLKADSSKQMNNQRNKQDGDGESSTLASISKSDDYYSSSDAIYGEKPDLMRVMFRNTYNKQSKNIISSGLCNVSCKNNDVPVEALRLKKKPKRDGSEKRLMLLEAKHVRNFQRNKQQDGDGESSTLASTSESSDSYSSSEEMEPSSSSEKPGLMQVMLQNTDNQQSQKIEYQVNHDNNDEKGKKIDMLKQRSGDSDGNGGPRFKDLGGMDAVLEELRMEVIVPLYHPQLFNHLGVRPISGILFHGPPGCGKTKLAHAIANEAGVPFYKLSATELVSGVSGASEEKIRELFSKAYRTAPSIVFIDEIDAIASKRENLQREMERRIVTQLMTCMDESHRHVQPDDDDAKGTTLPTDKGNSEEKSDRQPGYVLVIGATNRPDAIDPALRRPGRFDREIALGIPDENARVQILSVLTRDLRVEGAFDLMKIARSTPGFVGADLASLSNKAGILAVKRIIDARKVELCRELVDGEDALEWWRKPWSSEEMGKLSISMADFEEAAELVQPSSKREGFSAIPNVKWEDVGGLYSLRHEFDRYIVRHIKNPKDYMGFGVDSETGFLLYGPPGCGKTLIAKAVANEAGANFIHIKGPEILSPFVGNSELAIRTMFTRARRCSPCILFFDEMDSLTTNRDKQQGGWVVERLLNQLLIELDGADERKGVYVIGATNRPQAMDQAILRPGRLGRLLYVPLPSPDERGLILKALSRKKPIDSSVDLVTIGRDDACTKFSGADLAALMNEAAMLALEDKLMAIDTGCGDIPSTIKESHFKRALEKISPSVSDEQIENFEKWKRDA